ncbi:uncharacterized protein LOC131927608 [Physella acuta]|uniref:uncharacterized protein LOC131927608 n=1 Tax=Physella acuta TaxID=109671 RepID=UPI0027DCC9F1|nr:uncharacterized protein LOC131927608 [Physella acuta]
MDEEEMVGDIDFDLSEWMIVDDDDGCDSDEPEGESLKPEEAASKSAPPASDSDAKQNQSNKEPPTSKASLQQASATEKEAKLSKDPSPTEKEAKLSKDPSPTEKEAKLSKDPSPTEKEAKLSKDPSPSEKEAKLSKDPTPSEKEAKLSKDNVKINAAKAKPPAQSPSSKVSSLQSNRDSSLRNSSPRVLATPGQTKSSKHNNPVKGAGGSVVEKNVSDIGMAISKSETKPTTRQATSKSSKVLKPVDNKNAATVKPVDSKNASTVVKPVDSKDSSTAVKPVDSKDSSTVVKPVDSKDSSTVVKPVDSKDSSTVVKPVDSKDSSTVVKPVDSKDSSTFDNKNASTVKPVDSKDSSTVVKLVDSKDSPTVVKPFDSKDSPTVVKPVENKDSSTVVKPVDSKDSSTVVKPVDNKNASTVKPVDSKNSSTVKPVESKNSSTVVKPVDSKNSSTVVKPVDSKDSPTVAKPVDSKNLSTALKQDDNKNSPKNCAPVKTSSTPDRKSSSKTIEKKVTSDTSTPNRPSNIDKRSTNSVTKSTSSEIITNKKTSQSSSKASGNATEKKSPEIKTAAVSCSTPVVKSNNRDTVKLTEPTTEKKAPGIKSPVDQVKKPDQKSCKALEKNLEEKTPVKKSPTPITSLKTSLPVQRSTVAMLTTANDKTDKAVSANKEPEIKTPSKDASPIVHTTDKLADKTCKDKTESPTASSVQGGLKTTGTLQVVPEPGAGKVSTTPSIKLEVDLNSSSKNDTSPALSSNTLNVPKTEITQFVDKTEHVKSDDPSTNLENALLKSSPSKDGDANKIFEAPHKKSASPAKQLDDAESLAFIMGSVDKMDNEPSDDVPIDIDLVTDAASYKPPTATDVQSKDTMSGKRPLCSDDEPSCKKIKLERSAITAAAKSKSPKMDETPFKSKSPKLDKPEKPTPTAPSSVADSSTSAPANKTNKRIVRRFHRSIQTLPKEIQNKLIHCQIKIPALDCPPKTISQAGVQADPVEPSKWTDKVRYHAKLPEIVPENVFLAVSDFDVNKPRQQDYFPGKYSYGICLGQISTADLFKYSLKEGVFPKCDSYNIYFQGLDVGILELFFGNKEKFLAMVTHLRKIKLGLRYLVVTFSYNLEENEMDPLQKLTHIKATVLVDQNFSSTSYLQFSKTPTWNAPTKIDKTMFLHNLPGGVPIEFFKIILPDALIIEPLDRTSKFTQEDRLIRVCLTKKFGCDHLFDLFMQLYVNNQYVICTESKSVTAAQSRIKEIQQERDKWQAEEDKKFPKPDFTEKILTCEPRDINVDTPTKPECSPDGIQVIMEVEASEKEDKILMGKLVEKTAVHATADLSDISDSSDLDLGNPSKPNKNLFKSAKRPAHLRTFSNKNNTEPNTKYNKIKTSAGQKVNKTKANKNSAAAGGKAKNAGSKRYDKKPKKAEGREDSRKEREGSSISTSKLLSERRKKVPLSIYKSREPVRMRPLARFNRLKSPERRKYEDISDEERPSRETTLKRRELTHKRAEVLSDRYRAHLRERERKRQREKMELGRREREIQADHTGRSSHHRDMSAHVDTPARLINDGYRAHHSRHVSVESDKRAREIIQQGRRLSLEKPEPMRHVREMEGRPEPARETVLTKTSRLFDTLLQDLTSHEKREKVKQLVREKLTTFVRQKTAGEGSHHRSRSPIHHAAITRRGSTSPRRSPRMLRQASPSPMRTLRRVTIVRKSLSPKPRHEQRASLSPISVADDRDLQEGMWLSQAPQAHQESRKIATIPPNSKKAETKEPPWRSQVVRKVSRDNALPNLIDKRGFLAKILNEVKGAQRSSSPRLSDVSDHSTFVDKMRSVYGSNTEPKQFQQVTETAGSMTRGGGDLAGTSRSQVEAYETISPGRQNSPLGSHEGMSYNRSQEPRNSNAFERNTNVFDRNISTSDRNTNTFDRNISTFDRNTNTFDRNISTFDRNTNTFDRNISMSDRNTNTFERNTTSFDHNTALDRNANTFDRNTNMFDRNNTSADRNTSTFESNSTSFDRNTNPYDHNTNTFDNNSANVFEQRRQTIPPPIPPPLPPPLFPSAGSQTRLSHLEQLATRLAMDIQRQQEPFNQPSWGQHSAPAQFQMPRATLPLTQFPLSNSSLPRQSNDPPFRMGNPSLSELLANQRPPTMGGNLSGARLPGPQDVRGFHSAWPRQNF